MPERSPENLDFRFHPQKADHDAGMGRHNYRRSFYTRIHQPRYQNKCRILTGKYFERNTVTHDGDSNRTQHHRFSSSFPTHNGHQKFRKSIQLTFNACLGDIWKVRVVLKTTKVAINSNKIFVENGPIYCRAAFEQHVMNLYQRLPILMKMN